MFENALSAEAVQEALEILQHEFPLALWETVYVTLLSTAFAIVLGLPLGILLVAITNYCFFRIVFFKSKIIQKRVCHHKKRRLSIQQRIYLCKKSC